MSRHCTKLDYKVYFCILVPAKGDVWKCAPCLAIIMTECLLGLLLSGRLELGNLLQTGNLEGSVGLAALHLQTVNLHVPLLDLVLHVELLSKDGAALVVELLDKDSKVVLRTFGKTLNFVPVTKYRLFHKR